MRKKVDFNKGWKFHKGDLFPRDGADGWSGAKSKDNNSGAAGHAFDDSDWQVIDLPHDYLIDGDYTQSVSKYPEGATQAEREMLDSRLIAGGCLEPVPAWYRKWLKFTPENESQRVNLYFDGVFRDCLLYVNGYYVKRHESGYESFYADITDFLDFERDNLIAVRVNPKMREGWWYEGAGIYRNVWLEISEGIRFAPYGIYVCPDVDIDSKSANIHISTELENNLYSDESVTVSWEISDTEGKILARGEKEHTVHCRDNTFETFDTSLSDVTLWDIDNPYLYSLTARLYSGNVLFDELQIPFGIRHTRFDENKGFFLNGRHLKIKGVCCHQDHAGIGIAENKDVFEYRVSLLKDMGANAYRTAHHMASPSLLEVCDRLGMLVFEETRRMSSCDEDLRCIRTMVKRDRNHPCIFLWGIGNEELSCQGSPEMTRATKHILYEIKKLDSLRPVTSGVVMKDAFRQYENADFCMNVTKNLDVMGFNYEVFAWDDYHKKMPEQPIIITEATSNSSTRGCYETERDNGLFWIKDKDNLTKCKGAPEIKLPNEGEDEWSACLERDYTAGIFIWTGFDYRGEPCPVTYPAILSYFGIFDYCGFPKDNYYYYKSHWQAKPVLHLLPHMNLHNKVGKKIDFYAFSNLDSAELLINGKSYGISYNEKNRYIMWENVKYELGTAEVIGFKDGKEVLRKKVVTCSEPVEICADVFKDKINVGGTAIINIRLCDKAGNTVPYADNRLRFEVSGSGSFLGCGNGNPADHDKDSVPERRAYGGLCQLLVKAKKQGTINVRISSKNFADKEIKLEVI